MKNTGTLQVTTPSDREILMTRVFEAPRHLVFEAMTRADLLKRWYDFLVEHLELLLPATIADVTGSYTEVYNDDCDVSYQLNLGTREISDKALESGKIDMKPEYLAYELPALDPNALKSLIREVPDFPKPGILFYDVTTLLRDPEGFKLSIDSMEFSLRSSQQQLENQKEELKQLEKMYRSKDLTEETEEIILKRQRFAVEQSEHFLRLTKNRRDQVINVDLPRREREMKDGLRLGFLHRVQNVFLLLRPSQDEPRPFIHR